MTDAYLALMRVAPSAMVTMDAEGRISALDPVTRMRLYEYAGGRSPPERAATSSLSPLGAQPGPGPLHELPANGAA